MSHRNQTVRKNRRAAKRASPKVRPPTLTTPLRLTGKRVRVHLTELFWPDDDRRTRLASQVGVRKAIVNVLPVLKSMPANGYVAGFAEDQKRL